MQAVPTKLAIHTYIPHRLDTTSVTYLPILHISAYLDDNTSALVTWRPDFELGHLGHGKIF
jgi:hypothetical protein